MSNNSDGFNFLTSVSTVKLHRSNKSLNNGAECFSEFFSLISAGGVGYENLGLSRFGSDVINEAWIFDLY